jgi:hypothetical protein
LHLSDITRDLVISEECKIGTDQRFKKSLFFFPSSRNIYLASLWRRMENFRLRLNSMISRCEINIERELNILFSSFS